MDEEKVKQMMQQILERLDSEEIGLTISPSRETEYVLAPRDILHDLTIFAEEVFDAELLQETQSLRVTFRNGQTFRISVEEEF